MNIIKLTERVRLNSTKMLCLATCLSISLCPIGCSEQAATGGANKAASTTTGSPNTIVSAAGDEDLARATVQSLRVIQTQSASVTLETPEDLTVECDGDGNQGDLDAWLDAANAESTCGVSSFTNDFTALSDDCGATGSSTVTWTVLDECDESQSASGTFTIADTSAPTIDGPEDLSLVCDDALFQDKVNEWLAAATASDDCGDASVGHDFVEILAPCDAAGTGVLVTWTATDACGLTATHAATLTIFGTETTLTLSGPDDLDLDCGDPDRQVAIVKWLEEATAEGDCTGINVVHDFAGLSDDCGETGAATVTWTATDDCGNLETHTATVTVSDSTPPTVDAPEDLVVSCDDETFDTQLEEWLTSATGSDDCGPVELSNDHVSLPGQCQDGASTTVVTWTATDKCLQTATDTASLIVTDDSPPTITGPEDMSVECGDGDTQAKLEAWLASAEASDNCGDALLVNDFEGLSDDCGETGSAMVTWTAADGCGNTSTYEAIFAVKDAAPPTIVLIGDEHVSLECGEEYVEHGADATDACDTGEIEVTIGGDEVDSGNSGEYIVEYTATDACGNEATATRTVTVEDAEPPTIPDDQLIQIWPPNHKYHTFQLSDCGIEDDCESDLDVSEMGHITSIYSDEPENSNGDGNTNGDIIIVDASTFSVRAERRGGSNGRVYGVNFEISDAAGNTLIGVCRIGVPHDQSGNLPVDDGAEAGYTVD